MKKNIFCLLAAMAISGCASTPPNSAATLGRFVMSGPASVVAPELSMRWQYALSLTVAQRSITDVKFSCAPLPGTTFIAKGSEFKQLENGALFIEGPVLPISQESTPWLFEKSTTTASCMAAVTVEGQPEALITAPVVFPPSVKAATLAQMKMAHEFNSPSPK